MKHITILMTFLFLSLSGFTQDVKMEFKLDSILNEADLLYRYEKSVWVSTDLFFSNKKLSNDYGGFVVNHVDDTTSVSILNSSFRKVLAKYDYIGDDFKKPLRVMDKEKRNLTTLEQDLWDSKIKILEQLSSPKYDISIPEGYSPNFVLIKDNRGCRFYIIMGTSQSGVIPFGNDYLFTSDLNGEVISWKKFHSRLIPVHSQVAEYGKVRSCSHSHLKSTPYITATDICTFRLYAGFTDIKEFTVYSPTIDCSMTYNIVNGKIEVSK